MAYKQKEMDVYYREVVTDFIHLDLRGRDIYQYEIERDCVCLELRAQKVRGRGERGRERQRERELSTFLSISFVHI